MSRIARHALLFMAISTLAATAGFYFGRPQTVSPPALPKITSTDDAPARLLALTLPDLSGRPQSLAQWKGKVLVVNFWATWCPPCRKELPDLSTISTELKDKDFKMIGVSVDDNQEVLNNFLKSNNLPYTIVFEPNELVQKYMNAAGQNQNVVPQTYIIDKNGKVVEAIMGSRSKSDFLSIINKYL